MPQKSAKCKKRGFKDGIHRYCSAAVIIDHTFFSNMANGDKDEAIEEVYWLVSEADETFKNTDFDFDEKPD